LIREGAFEVIISPLDRYSYSIAKLLARYISLARLWVSAATTVGSLYTFDCVWKEAGLEPILFPLIARLTPKASSLPVDPAIAREREHKILMERLKHLHTRHLSLTQDEKLINSLFESKIISK
jgi:hypothetical protein